MDFQKMAEEVLRKIWDLSEVDWKYDGPEIGTVIDALEHAYKEGAKAMRKVPIEAVESDAAQLRKDCEDMAYATGDMAIKLVAAEATCQSLLNQSSRWEAQALEAEVRIKELEGCVRELRKYYDLREKLDKLLPYTDEYGRTELKLMDVQTALAEAPKAGEESRE